MRINGVGGKGLTLNFLLNHSFRGTDDVEGKFDWVWKSTREGDIENAANRYLSYPFKGFVCFWFLLKNSSSPSMYGNFANFNTSKSGEGRMCCFGNKSTFEFSSQSNMHKTGEVDKLIVFI